MFDDSIYKYSLFVNLFIICDYAGTQKQNDFILLL